MRGDARAAALGRSHGSWIAQSRLHREPRGSGRRRNTLPPDISCSFVASSVEEPVKVRSVPDLASLYCVMRFWVSLMTDIRIHGFDVSSPVARSVHVRAEPLAGFLGWRSVLIGALVLPLAALGASYAGFRLDRLHAPVDAQVAISQPDVERTDPAADGTAESDLVVFGALPAAVTPSSAISAQSPLSSLKDALTHESETTSSAIEESETAVAVAPAVTGTGDSLAATSTDADAETGPPVAFAPPSSLAPAVEAPVTHGAATAPTRSHLRTGPVLKPVRGKVAHEEPKVARDPRKAAPHIVAETRVAATPRTFTLPQALQPTGN